MTQIIRNLGPIFLIMVLGAILARHGWLTEGFTKPLNRLVYWIALPSLVVVSLASAHFDAQAALKVFAVFMAGTLGSLALAALVCLALRVSAPQFGSFVQAAFRGNLSLIGLPVLTYQISGSGLSKPEGAALLATGAIVMGAGMIVYNILSIMVLLPCQKHHEPGVHPQPPHPFQQIVTNPLIIASVGGALLGGFSVPVPEVIMGTLRTLGSMAVPGALLCIGASLGTAKLKGRVLLPSLTAMIKVGATPVFTLVAAAYAGLPPQQLMLAMLLSACPTAAASFVLAERMGGDAHLAGSAIALSTVFSVASLAVVLAVFV